MIRQKCSGYYCRTFCAFTLGAVMLIGAGFRLPYRGRGFGRGISLLTALGTKGEIPPGMLRDRCAPFGTTNWCHPEGRVYGRGISQLTNPKSGADPSSPKLLLRMTKKCNPKSRTSPSVAALVRDNKHKRLVRDDDEGFVILSECEGSRGWVSPESKPRSSPCGDATRSAMIPASG